MSTQKRRIGYWSLDFVSGDDHHFNDELFCKLMSYLSDTNSSERLIRESRQNKAISLETINAETKQGMHIYKVIFKSCKYNHSPDYMSSIDGSERPSDKSLTEGDKELTHMCILVNDAEAYTILEERRNGVSMNGIVTYFNRFMQRFIDDTDGIEDNFILGASIVPPDDFLASLNQTSRISSVELFVEKRVLGSEYLNLMEIDANSQDDLTITVKAKPRQGLAKRALEQVYNGLTAGGTQVNRIRIRGKDINKMDVTIDSLNGKKVDEITVDLLENGIVDSYSIFSKMEELLGITE